MKYLYTIVFALFVSTVAFCQAGDAPSVQTLEVKPDFPGGINEFRKYVGSNIRTPDVKEDMVVKILVAFIIEKDGTMSTYEIIEDPGYGMGAEAVRVLKSCKTKWSPGYQDGKPVRARYTLPITLKVTGYAKEEKEAEENQVKQNKQ